MRGTRRRWVHVPDRPFLRSLHIREVSTGCSATDLEVAAINNPIFDAASITKVAATTPAIWLLIQRGKIGLDATNKMAPETKREWGRPIRMADDIVAEVTRKWADYGLPGAGKPIWK